MPGARLAPAAQRLAALARRAGARPVLCHLLVLGSCLAAGVAVTWPRATYLADGTLPGTRDAGSDVWGFWWVAHQVTHLGNPWFTHDIAAPSGAPLAFHTLMPLAGVLMTPVTLAFGAAATANLLSVALPGLLCYVMYRAARLWLTSQAGALTAGAFFGLSSMLDWRSWYQLNLAAGALFLPLALEAAVRLRRKPGRRQAVVLGLVLGASLLTDQESALLACILAALVLAPWLVRQPGRDKVRTAAVAAGSALVVGGPQIAAMAWQALSAGAPADPSALGGSYDQYATGVAGLFAPSPRVADFGLTRLGAIYYHDGLAYERVSHHLVATSEATPMYGAALSLLAVLGIVVARRRRGTWPLAALWLGSAVLALGPVLWVGTHVYTPFAETLDGARVSALMPYTWFVQIPGLSGFREAGRLAELGIVPAALLAGAAADWLRSHAAALLAVVLAAAVLEAGWSGNPPVQVMPASYRIATMPAALPGLDAPIAADRTQAVVVDFPFGVAGGTGGYAARFDPEAQVLATEDGHPRAVGFLARVPATTAASISRNAFYGCLVQVWRGGQRITPAEVSAARQAARAADIGWVLVWPQRHERGGSEMPYWNRGAIALLNATGFRFGYQADGVRVYRAQHSSGAIH